MITNHYLEVDAQQEKKDICFDAREDFSPPPFIYHRSFGREILLNNRILACQTCSG